MKSRIAHRSHLVAGVFFGCTLVSDAQSILPKDSPFLPPLPASGVTAPGEVHELAAFATIGGAITVNIYDRAMKKGRWIPVGSAVEGITVVNFDEQRHEAVVRIAGTEKVLPLRKATRPSLASADASVRPNFPLPTATAPVR